MRGREEAFRRLLRDTVVRDNGGLRQQERWWEVGKSWLYFEGREPTLLVNGLGVVVCEKKRGV